MKNIQSYLYIYIYIANMTMNKYQIMKWGMSIPKYSVVKIRTTPIILKRKCIVCESKLGTNTLCDYCEHKLDEVRGELD